MKYFFDRFNWRRGVSVVLLLIIICPSIFLTFPQKAEAQWVVWDPSVSIKEYLLDNLAWMIVTMIQERIVASTVNWINTGFQGSPAFVTDPTTFYKDIGDQVAGQIIYNHPDTQFMCAGFSAKVRIALTQNYIQPFGNYQCTLTGIVDNFDDFMNDFNAGGWDGFVEISQNSQSNPLGLYNQQRNQLYVTAGSALGQKQEELSWGNGFLSSQKCDTYGVPTVRTVTEGGRFELQPDGTNKYVQGTTRQVNDPPPCLQGRTETPGSVIQNQLNKALGIGNDRLQVADEINEIVSALLGQLTAKAIGAVGSGLRSLSSPDSTNNGNTYTQQLTDSQGRTITPMPASGQCPGGTSRYSATECATDPNVIANEVIQSEVDADNQTAVQDGQINQLINPPAANPPTTSCFVDPNDPNCTP